MTRRLVSPDDFANAVRTGAPPDQAAICRAVAEPPELGQNGRMVRYTLSTPNVARDNHVIYPDAWLTENYLKDPVFLWCHDDSLLPIGRMVEIGLVGDCLKGTVEYAGRDLNPFADSVYQMVRSGFLNAVSVSWDPIAWRFSTDKSRPGGIDFSKVDLLEVSQVTLPADPQALVEARRLGIDTGPIFRWAEQLLDRGGAAVIPRLELEQLRRAAKMPAAARPTRSAPTPKWEIGAPRSLPLARRDTWDGPEAEKRVFAWAGFDGDTPDPAKAREAFLAYDSANPTDRGSYKLPIADIVDGDLTAITAGLSAAASRLPDTDIPDDIRTAARAVLDHYEARAKALDDKTDRAALTTFFKRGLYHVGWLAFILEDLGCLAESVEWEAAMEQDGSVIPADLATALQKLGAILVAMTAEEVGELIADPATPDPDGDADDATARGILHGLGRMMQLGRTDDLAQIRDILAAQRRGERLVVTNATTRSVLARFEREGRVLSAENERCLREAHGNITAACDKIRGVFEQAANDPEHETDAGEPDEDPDEAESRAIRERRARALLRLNDILEPGDVVL